MEHPTFRRTYLPGVEMVEITSDWPNETQATREFLQTADQRWLQRNLRTLSFTLANGSATYRMVSFDKTTGIYNLKRAN